METHFCLYMSQRTTFSDKQATGVQHTPSCGLDKKIPATAMDHPSKLPPIKEHNCRHLNTAATISKRSTHIHDQMIEMPPSIYQSYYHAPLKLSP